MIADTPKVDNWSKIEAPEGLRFLSTAAESEASASEDVSRADRFLALHEVPQIALEGARGAFPLLESAYPIEWKQQVRQLRARLSQMQMDVSSRQQPALQVVSISSLRKECPRLGLAQNLAYMLATIQDNRVLMIDARLGERGIAESIGLENASGLCEATRLKRDQLPNCMLRISGSQLYLMPSGQADTFGFDPVDLRGLHFLMHGLRKQFDWVIVDAPAYDNPADAMAVGQCADGALFVVERERDHFAKMSRALGETQGRYLLGAVMV
jgi:Mrp family chromosome partitioning ATPase